MNDLLKLIGRGENERLELKESLRLKEEICQVVSAFSNANGGSILELDPETPFREALEKLELLKGAELTNAAILLFGKNRWTGED